jgi:predicted small lipoprotein YifL
MHSISPLRLMMTGKGISELLFVACLAGGLLTGCGQSGDLYLPPEEPDRPSESEPPPPAPAGTVPLGPGPGAPTPLEPTVPAPLGSIPLEPEPAEAPLEPEEPVEATSE